MYVNKHGCTQTLIEQFGIGRYITKPADLDEYLQIGFIPKDLLTESGRPPS